MRCTCNLDIKRIVNILIRTSTKYDTDRHRDPWNIATEKYRVVTVIEPLARYAEFLLEQLEQDILNFYLKLL